MRLSECQIDKGSSLPKYTSGSLRSLVDECWQVRRTPTGGPRQLLYCNHEWLVQVGPVSCHNLQFNHMLSPSLPTHPPLQSSWRPLYLDSVVIRMKNVKNVLVYLCQLRHQKIHRWISTLGRPFHALSCLMIEKRTTSLQDGSYTFHFRAVLFVPFFHFLDQHTWILVTRGERIGSPARAQQRNENAHRYWLYSCSHPPTSNPRNRSNWIRSII